MAFEHESFVSFSHVDRALTVFHGRYMEYCQVALDALFIAAFGDRERQFVERPYFFPIVKTEYEFYAPGLNGDALSTCVELERVGNSSITFQFRVMRRGDRVVLCRARFVHVFVSKEDRTKIPVAEGFVEALEAAGVEHVSAREPH